MPAYNLMKKYGLNYSETTGSLQLYSNDEATDFNAIIANTFEFTSFKCRANFSGNTVAAEFQIIQQSLYH